MSKLHGCPGVLMQVPWEILQSWNHISVRLIRYSQKAISIQSVDNGSCFYCEICNSRNELNIYIMKTATWGKMEMIFVSNIAPNYRYTVCKCLKTLELQCNYANLMHDYLYFKISLISLFMKDFPLTAVDVFVGMPWGNTTFTKHWTTHESSGSTMSLKSTITRKFHPIMTCSFRDEHLISKYSFIRLLYLVVWEKNWEKWIPLCSVESLGMHNVVKNKKNSL